MISQKPASERGAALLSVLMIVAAMSVAAVTAIDALARSISVSRAGQFRAEATWAIRSAEALGTSYLAEVIDQTEGRVLLQTPLLGEPQVFSTARFNVTANLTAAGNCFNLNAIAISLDGESEEVNQREYDNYLTLLRGVGIFEGEARKLADTLADWLDSDDISRSSGAESSYYSTQDVPHRSSGQLLVNLSELNAIAGYTPEIQTKLKNLVCAYPTTRQNTLNINLLRSDQAPLLQALFSSELSIDSARGLIDVRPATGWVSVEEFLALDENRQIAEKARMAENIAVTTRYFEMKVDLRSPDQTAYGDYLFEALPKTGVQLIWLREGGQR